MSRSPVDRWVRRARLALRLEAAGLALGSAVAVLGASALGLAAFDRAQHLPPWARAAALPLAAAGLALLGRGLGRRLADLRSARAAARVAELRLRRGNDLISEAAVWADVPTAERTGFHDLIRSRAEAAVSAAPWRALRWPALALVGVLAAGSVAGVVAGAMHHPDDAHAAVRRWLDPFGGHGFPPRTQLALHAPALVALGSSADLTLAASGRLPDSATIEVRGDGVTRSLNVPLDGGRARVSLSTAGLPEWVTLTARAGDGVSEPVRLHVRPAPALASAPSVTVAPPTYTLLTPVRVEPGAAAEVPAGGTVALDLLFDRPVASARVEPPPAGRPEWLLLASPIAAAAVLPGWDVAIECDADGHRAFVSWEPSRSGPHRVVWRDADGLAGETTIMIRRTVDPVPEATLAFADGPPTGGGLPLSALLRLRAVADDPRYGLLAAALEVETPGGRFVESLLPPAGPLATVLGAGLRPAEPVSSAAWIFERPVAAYRRGDGSPLRPGDRLRFRLVAKDRLEEPFRPDGRSEWLELRVLADGEWRAAWRARLADVARELNQAAGVQDQARSSLLGGVEADPERRRDASFRAEQWQAALRSQNLGADSPLQKMLAELSAPGAPAEAGALRGLRQQLAGLDADGLKPTEARLREWGRPKADYSADEARRLADQMTGAARQLRGWAGGLDAEPRSAKLPGEGWKLLDKWRNPPTNDAGPESLANRTLDWLERLRQQAADAAARRDRLREELGRATAPNRREELRAELGRATDEAARLGAAAKPEAADRLAKLLGNPSPDPGAVAGELGGIVERVTDAPLKPDPVAEARDEIDTLRKKKRPDPSEVEKARDRLLGHADTAERDDPGAAERIRRAAEQLAENPEAALDRLTRREAPAGPPDEVPAWAAEQERVVEMLGAARARPLERATLLKFDEVAALQLALARKVERSAGPGRAVVRDLADRMADCSRRVAQLLEAELARLDDLAVEHPAPDATGREAACEMAADLWEALRGIMNRPDTTKNGLDRADAPAQGTPNRAGDPWAARYLLERQTRLAERTAKWRAGNARDSEAGRRTLDELGAEQRRIAELLRRVAGEGRP